MSSPASCPKCGKPIPSGSPGGICPACLIQAGLSSSWVDLGTKTHHSPGSSSSAFVPPGIDILTPLFPQLELIRVLGHGGMGAVYLARQKSLDRLVALKIIRPESAGAQGFAERFSREARALARLNHPGIVGVHDFGSVPVPASDALAQPTTEQPTGSSSLFFLLMEYVDGASVRQLIAGKNLSPREALAIVPQICEALQFAHDMGVVHRDIKPENILLDQRGRVKIADFGLAKLTATDADDHSLTGTHQIMGTPRYMAPEQLEQSRTIDHRADIYSLGVVFYEMLTGEIPMGMFDPPSKKVQVDERLDRVVLRSLAREPDRRYQHASEIKTDVDLVASNPVDWPEVPLNSDNRAPIASFEKNVDPLKARTESKWLRLQLTACLIGLLATLVPYFYYSSCFWGIGSYISVNKSPLELTTIYDDTPAWKSGFRSGDQIIEPRDIDSALSALDLVQTGQGRQRFKVQRDDQQISIWADPVPRQIVEVDYPSAWYPVVGFIFLVLGLSIFVFDTQNPNQLWPSLVAVVGGLVLVVGCIVALFSHSVFTRIVLWQIPMINRHDDWRTIHFGQSYIAVLASLILTGLGAARLRSRIGQRENKLVSGVNDIATLVVRPATALAIVAWLAIPAFLITALIEIVVLNYQFELKNPDGTRSPWAMQSMMFLVLLFYATVFFTAPAISIVLIAATRMRDFQSRGLAIAGSVLIMMPFSLIALAGIPVGIWSLRVLMRDDVRRAFDGKTVPTETTCAQIQKAGIWMVVSGALALLLPTGLFIYAMTQTVMQGQFTGEQDKFLVGILGLALPSLILAGLQIFAGIKMKNRTSFRWSYFSAIFGLVPLNPAWLVSFPSAVYAFAVLGQQTDGVKNNSELFGPSRK